MSMQCIAMGRYRERFVNFAGSMEIKDVKIPGALDAFWPKP